MLKANASWLAPNHYVPHMDRLIVTIQLWVLHAGGNVIVIDTGVGNRKPRPARAHGPAQHAGDAVARSRSAPGPSRSRMW